MSNRRGDQVIMVEDLLLLVTTENAYGVTTDSKPYASAAEAKAKGRKEVEAWIPKSLTEETDLRERGDIGYISMPRWLAEKNDLPHWE